MDKTTFNVGDVFRVLVDVALSSITIKQGERIKIVDTETSVSYSNFDIETSKGVRSEGWGAVRFRAGPHQFFAHIPYGLFTGDLAVATLDNFYPVGTVLRATDTRGHLVKLDAMGAKTSGGLECDGWFHEAWFTAGDACFRKLTEAEREAFEHYEKINSGVFCKANVRHVNGTWFHFDQNRILSLMLNTEQAEPAKDNAAPADVGPKFTIGAGSMAPNTITFRTSNDPAQEMLRITQDGFYVRGVKVEQGDGEANAVFEEFKAFLGTTESVTAWRKQQEELETLRGQLAACGVAAVSNTRASAEEQAIESDNPYYSDSYQLVVNAVAREMDHREKRDELCGKVQSLQEQLRQRTVERDSANAKLEKTAIHIAKAAAWDKVCEAIHEIGNSFLPELLDSETACSEIRALKTSYESLKSMHGQQKRNIIGMMDGLDRIGMALGLGDNIGCCPYKAEAMILIEIAKHKLTVEDAAKIFQDGQSSRISGAACPHKANTLQQLIHGMGWLFADRDVAFRNDARSNAAVTTLQSLGYSYTRGAEAWKPPVLHDDTFSIVFVVNNGAAPDACDERAGFPVHHPV